MLHKVSHVVITDWGKNNAKGCVVIVGRELHF